MMPFGRRSKFSCTKSEDIIDLYDSPRDKGVQLQKFLSVLAAHLQELEEQMTDLQANLEQVKLHEKEAKGLLAKLK